MQATVKASANATRNARDYPTCLFGLQVHWQMSDSYLIYFQEALFRFDSIRTLHFHPAYMSMFQFRSLTLERRKKSELGRMQHVV